MTISDMKRPITIRGLQRTLLWIGAGITLAVVLVSTYKTGYNLLREARSWNSTWLKMLFACAFMAIWMLAPYLAAFRMQRKSAETRAEAGVLLVSFLLIAALGAYAYLPGFVFYTGRPSPTGQAFLVVVVPLCQGVILAITWVLRWVVRGLFRKRDGGGHI